MAHLYASLLPPNQYWDKKSGLSRENWLAKAAESTTVYVGNLAFHTSEDQIYELFSKAGEIDVISMGLNRNKKVPCGFCFVRFEKREGAIGAVELLNESICDERIIRVDWDTGDGVDGARRYGRGIDGGQWRDVFRKDYDAGRGGEGKGFDPSTNFNRKRRRDSEPGYNRDSRPRHMYSHNR